MPQAKTKQPAMVIRSVEFIKSAAKLNQCPDSEMPEVAFAGRSNVGKSSLMNMLLGRKNLVKVSSRPGRTQLLNFFSVNESFHLVDLPGYGFAKAPIAMRNNWQTLIVAYLSHRPQLAAVVLLLDVRRTPSEEDHAVIDLFREVGVPCIITVTKSDKLPQQQRSNQIRKIAQSLGLKPGDIVPSSAIKNMGREKLWQILSMFVASPVFADGADGEGGDA